jgi:hypothetical protein
LAKRRAAAPRKRAARTARGTARKARARPRRPAVSGDLIFGGPGPGAAGDLQLAKPGDDRPGASASLGFAEFLTEVAQAMVDTQSRLDLQSEAYLQGSSNARPLPALFRLPRLKGQMKFALEKGQDKKLNLLFYSSSAAASTLQQHELDFELVAVPPPPESGIAPGVFAPQMPRLDLVFGPGQRRQWLGLVAARPDVADALGVGRGADPDTLTDVLLWQFLRADEDDQADHVVMLARAADGATARICLAQVTAPAGQAAAVANVLAVGPLPPWLAGFVDAFVAAAGRRQRELLAGRTG